MAVSGRRPLSESLRPPVGLRAPLLGTTGPPRETLSDPLGPSRGPRGAPRLRGRPPGSCRTCCVRAGYLPKAREVWSPEGGPSGGDAIEEAETADQDAENVRDDDDPLRSLSEREESLIKKFLMVPHAA